MKKTLSSIIALLICLCTVFTLASCGGPNLEIDTSSESATEETNPAEEDITDADSTTAETIFADMKKAYNDALAYSDPYSIDIDWTENENLSEAGKGSTVTSAKHVTKETYTADPTAGKSAFTSSYETFENGQMTSSTDQKTKVYSENNKYYLYQAMASDGQDAASSYNTLSSYALKSVSNEMLLKSFFTTEKHFTESFGDPFAASSASDLKKINTNVISEVKANQKAAYEAQGYTVSKITATADVAFSSAKDGTNILKRTISIVINIANEGGSYQKNLTIESLLKTKDGKITTFSSISTLSSIEDINSGSNYQTESSSSLTYTFDYNFNTKAFDGIKVSTPTDVTEAPDYFEVPLTLVINGNEVNITVIGEANTENTVATILESAVNERFSDPLIEYNSNEWYTDKDCKNKFDFSSITTVDKLQKIGKLYNNTFEVNGNAALFIDSGVASVNIPNDYKIVFGDTLVAEPILASAIVVETNDDNIYPIRYETVTGEIRTIKLNNEALNTADFQEDSDGSFFLDFSYSGGQIYFISHTSVFNKTCFTLDTYYVAF